MNNTIQNLGSVRRHRMMIRPPLQRFAAIVLLLASASLGRGAENLEGRWEGSVQIPGNEMAVVVDLARNDKGAWVGSIILPGMDVKGAPLDGVMIKDSEASFAIKAARGLEATFKGRLQADGRLTGDFVQGGNTAPFVLRRTTAPQVETPPHSSPVSKEFEGAWQGGYELFGYPRKVTVTLTNHGAEGASAQFVVVGKKTTNLPIDLVTEENDFITMDSHATGISYEGRLDRKATEIKGTLLQGPVEIPLVLRRAK
jgi:hypothetical protein